MPDTRVKRMVAAALLAVLVVSVIPPSARAEPAIGKPAPAFSGTDSHGKTRTLDEYTGKVIVLEWSNHDCPTVAKHYTAGAMQALQKEARKTGVIWLTILSSAEGEKGYVTGDEANLLTTRRDARPTAVILDPEREMAKAYGARVTPYMVVIDAEGDVEYMGAIDDQPTKHGGNPIVARNYVRRALADLAAGKKIVSVPKMEPYGCWIQPVEEKQK